MGAGDAGARAWGGADDGDVEAGGCDGGGVQAAGYIEPDVGARTYEPDVGFLIHFRV